MRRYVLSVILLIAVAATAQNMQKGDYGYLYCHMSDRGQYTAFALSRDGYHYEDVCDGDDGYEQRHDQGLGKEE